MIPMAGGSLHHALIGVNAADIFQPKLDTNACLTFSSDARLAVFWDRPITYPDASVLCGKPKFTDDRKDTLTNPTIIVEVLSPTTRNSGQGEKARLTANCRRRAISSSWSTTVAFPTEVGRLWFTPTWTPLSGWIR